MKRSTMDAFPTSSSLMIPVCFNTSSNITVLQTAELTGPCPCLQLYVRALQQNMVDWHALQHYQCCLCHAEDAETAQGGKRIFTQEQTYFDGHRCLPSNTPSTAISNALATRASTNIGCQVQCMHYRMRALGPFTTLQHTPGSVSGNSN